MEKRKYESCFSSDQQSTQPQRKSTNNIQSSYLYQMIPKHIRTKFSQGNQIDVCLYNCLSNLHYHTKIQQLHDLFDQIGADLNVWANKATPNQKSYYLLSALEKNIEQSRKKINNQTNSYLVNLQSSKKLQQSNLRCSEKPKNHDFDWLNLNTKNEMLKGKLKTKLVQTINQFKNEKKLREVMGKQLEDHEKVHLEDDSIDLFQDEKSKMNYQWTLDDQQMFLTNIKKLKQKFIQTEFLKNCHRYKFITDSQLKTLACQEISRKLDKSNKAFLSRQFLLDKYFSTKESLTQKQMKFILKTSPLLSKCVDKAFVRAAVKNIQYEDIEKMQLQIAQQIIDKFEMIRNLVKNSRKVYKQNQNNRAKNRIEKFEQMKKEQQVRQQMKSKLDVHKVKLIRNLNFRPQSAENTQKSIKRNQENNENIHDQDGKSPKKLSWPIPMNSYHPSTGLFIKDSNQQLNDQFNQYEKSYLKLIYNNEDQNSLKKDNNSKSAMINFYTGGPLDPSFSKSRTPLNKTNAFHKIAKKSNFDQSTLKTLCQAFKTAQYRKQLMDKLITIEIQSQEQDQFLPDKKAMLKAVAQFSWNQPTKRTKKSEDSDRQNSRNRNRTNEYQMQKALKDRIIEGKQKAKVVVYVKKLLSLAAQNSYLSLKALNAKFTPSQVNTTDIRGNTALYYATKNKNADFIDYLLPMKADVNIKCFKGATPLHNIFKSSDYSLICKCLTGPVAPNLNTLDDDNKTPLAYCCRKVLQMLGLQTGVVWVAPGQKLKFNNNSLLCKNLEGSNGNEQLQMRIDIRNKNNSKQSTSQHL